jgi:hypothetical protein
MRRREPASTEETHSGTTGGTGSFRFELYYASLLVTALPFLKLRRFNQKHRSASSPLAPARSLPHTPMGRA